MLHIKYDSFTYRNLLFGGLYYIKQIFILNRMKLQYPVKIIHDYKDRETMLTCLIVLEIGQYSYYAVYIINSFLWLNSIWLHSLFNSYFDPPCCSNLYHDSL